MQKTVAAAYLAQEYQADSFLQEWLQLLKIKDRLIVSWFCQNSEGHLAERSLMKYAGEMEPSDEE